MGINPSVREYERKAFTTVFGQRIRLVRCFQEAMSQVMMGRFISHYGRTSWVKMTYEERTKYIINAYIYFVSLPCLLSFFGEEILSNRYLDEYFSQFRGYNRYKIAVQSGGLPSPTITTWFDFVSALGYKLGFEYLLAKIGDIIGLPILMQQFIYEQMPKSFWADVVNPFYVVDWVNQNMNRDDFDLALTVVPSWLWYPLHPFVHLDWTVIKSYIQLLQAYKSLRIETEERAFVPPFIRGMKVKVKVDGVDLTELRIDDEGIVRFCVPKRIIDEKITVDATGLKFDIPLFITFRFDLPPYERCYETFWRAWNYPIVEIGVWLYAQNWNYEDYTSDYLSLFEGWNE